MHATTRRRRATTLRLNFAPIDRWAESRGAETEAQADREVATALALDRSTIWRYRHGQLRPSLSAAIAVARLIGVTVDDLVEEVAA